MKRDMDLVRIILFEIEEHGMVRSGFLQDNALNYKPNLVMSHLRLLVDAGFVEKALPVGMGGIFADFPMALTWEGHDFLDLARSETVWGEAKNKIRQHGVGFSIEILKGLLPVLTKQHLGI